MNVKTVRLPLGSVTSVGLEHPIVDRRLGHETRRRRSCSRTSGRYGSAADRRVVAERIADGRDRGRGPRRGRVMEVECPSLGHRVEAAGIRPAGPFDEARRAAAGSRGTPRGRCGPAVRRPRYEGVHVLPSSFRYARRQDVIGQGEPLSASGGPVLSDLAERQAFERVAVEEAHRLRDHLLVDEAGDGGPRGCPRRLDFASHCLEPREVEARRGDRGDAVDEIGLRRRRGLRMRSPSGTRDMARGARTARLVR